MATRTKKKTVVPPLNLRDAEKVMSSYATADAGIERVNAEMDAKFTKIREEYANELQDFQETKAESFEKMQMFSETYTELFKKKKSFETAHP